MCQMEAHVPAPSSTPDQTLRHHRDDALQGFHCTKGEISGSSDAAPAPPAADTGKKKRVQRAAKLKQCKLDARREQWLAKVAGKNSKPESCVSNQDDKQSGHWSGDAAIGSEDGTGLCNRGKDVHTEGPRSKWDSKSISYKAGEDNFSEGMSCASRVAISESRRGSSSVPEPECQSLPTSSSRYVVHTNQLDGSSTWSSSDTSSTRSNSSQSSCSSGGSGSDDEKEVDDWEVVADALHVQASVDEEKSHGGESRCRDDEREAMMSSSIAQGNNTMVLNSMANNYVLKPESRYNRSGTFAARTRADVGRAWRPDDTSRPPTLPRLSKQHSFPLPTGSASVWGASHGSLWGIPPAPSHCPICTEELDTTDSSFMPCSCGFRLCLFCHHKIASGDGRCPGCRKAYNPQVATKLSRTSNVRPRI